MLASSIRAHEPYQRSSGLALLILLSAVKRVYVSVDVDAENHNISVLDSHFHAVSKLAAA